MNASFLFLSNSSVIPPFDSIKCSVLIAALTLRAVCMCIDASICLPSREFYWIFTVRKFAFSPYIHDPTSIHRIIPRWNELFPRILDASKWKLGGTEKKPLLKGLKSPQKKTAIH